MTDGWKHGIPRRWRTAAARALLPLVLAGLVSTAGAEADPMAWLTRADEAVGHSNFTGTILLYENGSERVMRIQQGFDGKQVQQRLVALSGEECEILRREDESSVVFPDRRLVIYGYQRTESPIPNILQDMEQMSKYYELEIQGRSRSRGGTASRSWPSRATNIAMAANSAWIWLQGCRCGCG